MRSLWKFVLGALAIATLFAGVPVQQGPVFVASNAALEALKTPAAYPGFVTRLTYSSTSTAPPLNYTPSNSACTLNSGAGDGGSQVPSADGKCWLAEFPDKVDIRQFGALADGSTDAITAINAAVAYAKANGAVIYIPTVGTLGYAISTAIVLTDAHSISITGDPLVSLRAPSQANLGTTIGSYLLHTTDTNCFTVSGTTTANLTNLSCLGNGSTSSSSTVTTGLLFKNSAYESEVHGVLLTGYVRGISPIDRMKISNLTDDDSGYWPNLTNGYPQACVYDDGDGQTTENTVAWGIMCRAQSQETNATFTGNASRNWVDISLPATSATSSSQAGRMWATDGIDVCRGSTVSGTLYPCIALKPGTDFTLWDCGAAACAGSGGTQLFVQDVTLTTVSGNAQVTVADTTGYGTGSAYQVIADHDLVMPTYVVSVDSGTTMTLSNAPTYTGSLHAILNKAGIGSQGCAIGLSPTCAHLFEVRLVVTPASGQEVEVNWVDPLGDYILYENNGAENQYLFAHAGGYRTIFQHHAGYGGIIVNNSYQELNNVCMVVDTTAAGGYTGVITGDEVHLARNVRPPMIYRGGSGRCPKWISPTSLNNVLWWNSSDWTEYDMGNVSKDGVTVGSATSPINTTAVNLEFDLSAIACNQDSGITLTASEDGSTFLGGTSYMYNFNTASSAGAASISLGSTATHNDGAAGGLIRIANAGATATHAVGVDWFSEDTSGAAFRVQGTGLIVGTPAPLKALKIGCSAGSSVLTGKVRYREKW